MHSRLKLDSLEVKFEHTTLHLDVRISKDLVTKIKFVSKDIFRFSFLCKSLKLKYFIYSYFDIYFYSKIFTIVYSSYQTFIIKILTIIFINFILQYLWIKKSSFTNLIQNLIITHLFFQVSACLKRLWNFKLFILISSFSSLFCSIP